MTFYDGKAPTTQVGFLNQNGQRCCGTRGVAGNDHNATAYRMECTNCGAVYGANGTDVWQRKCPGCQGGADGIEF